MNFGEQFSSGDQGESRKAFWESGYKKCPKCGKSEISSKEHGAGCRMNGDGYGTEVFTCKACSWSTSFQYDEAASPYYYETRDWKKRDDISGWGVFEVKEWLEKEGVGAHIVAKFFKEEVDGEVLQRGILTREFMTGHPKWKLSDDDMEALKPLFKSRLKANL
mmetsp:Transcript_14367/g.36054  ORF Transcript_14367/g.36054 Transcript_14367/m.36054 type:complete len:163 (-) Transcript_14367:101-589(-)